MVGSYDAFISYNSSDRPLALEFASVLRYGFGVQVAYDERDIHCGDYSQDAMIRLIDESRTVVVLIGPEALGRWQEKEVRYAIEQSSSRSRRLRVMPVLLPHTNKNQVPGFLRQLSYKDASDGLGKGTMTNLALEILSWDPETAAADTLESDQLFQKQWIKSCLERSYDSRRGSVLRSLQARIRDGKNVIDFSDGSREITEGVFCAALSTLNEMGSSGDRYDVVSTLRFWDAIDSNRKPRSKAGAYHEGWFSVANRQALQRGVRIRRVFVCRKPRTDKEGSRRDQVRANNMQLMSEFAGRTGSGAYECRFLQDDIAADQPHFGIFRYGRSDAMMYAISPSYNRRRLVGLRTSSAAQELRRFRSLWERAKETDSDRHTDT